LEDQNINRGSIPYYSTTCAPARDAEPSFTSIRSVQPPQRWRPC